MKLRRFKVLVSEKGLDDFGASGSTFLVDQLVEGKIYEQADQSRYDENGRNAQPFFVDDNGCSRNIKQLLRLGKIIEVFEVISRS